MFCKNCGKEINEGTKFCNHCGASQEATAPQPTVANNTEPTTVPKKNSTLKIVIIAAVAVICFAIGSFVIAPSFSNDTPDDNASTSSQTDNTDDIKDTQNNNVVVNNDLEELTYNKDEISGSVWKSDLGAEAGSMTVSAGYCTENDLIYNITFSIELKKDFEQYVSFKTELENFEKQIKAANDDEMIVDFDKAEDGIKFFASFDGLEYADRSQRVKIAAELIGITANAEDVAFYHSNVDSELKSFGFN